MKTTDNDLPPQAHAEKEGGACLGAKKDRGCFVCGKKKILFRPTSSNTTEKNSLISLR